MIALPLAHHPVAEVALLFAPLVALSVALVVLAIRERRRSSGPDSDGGRS